MRELFDYLDGVAARAFGYDSNDCCTFIADWVALRTGRDPMAPVRGSYHGPEEAVAALRENGNLAFAVSRAMRRAGFALTRSPDIGAVGVVAVDGAMGGAIRMNDRFWVMWCEPGVQPRINARSLRLLAAWNV